MRKLIAGLTVVLMCLLAFVAGARINKGYMNQPAGLMGEETESINQGIYETREKLETESIIQDQACNTSVGSKDDVEPGASKTQENTESTLITNPVETMTNTTQEEMDGTRPEKQTKPSTGWNETERT